MISRYSPPGHGQDLVGRGQARALAQVELAALEGWAEVGAVPADSAQQNPCEAEPDPSRVAEIEEKTHHDLAAFVDAVAETLGPEGRWFHYGLTSSDVVDTSRWLSSCGLPAN